MDDGMREADPRKAIRLNNRTCIYCGCAFGTGLRPTVEHVIGRRFVPKGTMENRWNLIVHACAQCNGEKADLENDIAAITMQPDAAGVHADDTALLAAEAVRRAGRTFSRRTKRPVGQSEERLLIAARPMVGMSMTFGLVSPPQLVPERVFRLAQLHVGGFFYLITYDALMRCGGFAPGTFMPLLYAHRGDWGNPALREFERISTTYAPRFWGVAADGYFRVLIRRAPHDAALWSWALEWNKHCRVVGFFGDELHADRVAAALPSLEKRVIERTADRITTIRPECPLAEVDDHLFDLPAKKKPASDDDRLQ